MKKILAFVLPILVVFSLLLAACAPAAPATHIEAIRQAGTIKVGTSADYPPFESLDSSGNKVGFDIDLMEEIARRMGVKLEWVDLPFDGLIDAVQGGKIDLAISAFNYSEERDQKIDFTEEYFTSEDSFMVADAFTAQIASPEDIREYKVGVQTGTTQDGWLTDNLLASGQLPESRLFRYDRADQAALDLKTGNIDVLMSDYVPAQALVKQVGGIKVAYHSALSGGPMNIVIPEGDRELAAEINDIIQQLKGEGFIEQIAVKHMAGQ